MGAAEAQADRRTRLRAARLYLVIESDAAGRVLDGALAGGVDVVQLRDKRLADATLIEAGRRLRALCDRHGALLIVNDRPDLASACGADGVHLGQEDEAPDVARRTVGAEALVGVSTHSPAQVAAAEADPAVDYLGVGPVHETATKPGVAPVGLALVRHAAANARKPWFAIGGIDAGNAGEIVAAGARRIAVVRAIRDARDPAAAAAALRAAVGGEVPVGPAR